MKKNQFIFPILILFTIFLVGNGFLLAIHYTNNPDITGTWRFSLNSPGGELPFTVIIHRQVETLAGKVKNGPELIPFSKIEKTGDTVKFHFDHYDSVLSGRISPDGKKITGTWSRRSLNETRTTMSFGAAKGITYRFNSQPVTAKQAPNQNISGDWQIFFLKGEKKEPAKGIFKQNGNIVHGTFLTTVGDYRYLAGTFEKGILQLSVFDGAHAFLFKGQVDDRGGLKGGFWSRDSYFCQWTGEKGPMEMPSPYTLTKLTNQDNNFSFRFPNLNGQMVSSRDPIFKNSPLIVYIFGTWCPNCNDEAPFLEELYQKYHSRGLKIIGLANEFSGNFKKDTIIIKRYIKKYRLSWPILFMGIADKKKSALALKDLDRVLAYPTTVFMDRKHRVQKIYTGFNGPGTGVYHEKLKKEFHTIITSLL